MNRKRVWRIVGSIMLSLLFVVVLSRPSYAPHAGFPKDGCTPGFWKNHTDLWTGSVEVPGIGTVPLLPGTILRDVFTALRTSTYDGSSDPELNSLGGMTLLDALNFGGGSGTAGAARILLRAGVAGLLNAAHPDVVYGGSGVSGDPNTLRGQINSNLLLGTRTMLNFAARLESANEQGCPLSA